MKAIYFNNLNGLRFFAASMVLISHIEQVKDLRGLPSLYKYPLFSSLGTLGVVLFFVLSGFLITYLLIHEKETSPDQKISLKNFYMRRVLRIWPLYFIVVFLGLYLMPKLGFYEFSPEELLEQHNLNIIIPLFVFFLPNVVLVLFGGLPFLHQTWSIGTEEQFYLVWPFVIKYAKNLLRTLLLIIVVYSGIKMGLYIFKSNQSVHQVYSIWSSLSIVSLSVGAICAYVYRHYKNEFIAFASSRTKQLCLVLAFIAFACFSTKIPSVIRFDIFSVFFGYLILSLVMSDSFRVLEFKAFSYPGKISYGIYMWHPIAITLSMSLLSTHAENNLWLYLTSFAGTIVLAAISYELIEKPFLRLKRKYSSV